MAKMPPQVKAMLAAKSKKKSSTTSTKAKTKGSLHPKFQARMGNPKGRSKAK
jgi:hypothetical protein